MILRYSPRVYSDIDLVLRMTIGQLIECLVTKTAVLKGTEADGTPFNNIDIESIKDELEKLGYNRNGYEYLYNGMTGQKLKTWIFIGPTYYHRLKHLVLDKAHSRSRGPRTLLTRCAPEGFRCYCLRNSSICEE